MMFCEKGNRYCRHTARSIRISSHSVIKTRREHTKVIACGKRCEDMGVSIDVLVACPHSPEGFKNETIPEVARWYSVTKTRRRSKKP